MPSTVKVRIKAARNLASLTPTTITTPTSTPQGRPCSPINTTSPGSPPSTHVTVTLGGHSAVAEYDEDEDHIIGTAGTGGSSAGSGHHNRTTSSKFQWQNKGGNSMDNADGDNAIGGGGASSSARTSRCYSARTRKIRRSANPVFNEEFRFEVADDTLLQDEVRNSNRVNLPDATRSSKCEKWS